MRCPNCGVEIGVSSVKSKKLTKAQDRVYRYIVDYQLQNGMSPSYREIADGLGFSSVNAVKCHLGLMEKKGVLRVAVGLARGIVLL